MEFTPEDGAPVRSCWGNVIGFPAEAYEFRRAGRGQRGTLRVWVSEFQAQSEPLPQSEQGSSPSGSAYHAYQQRVNGRMVDLIDVRIEDRPVANALGETRTDHCLVVRIAHSKDNPVIARVDDGKLGAADLGCEHHFYGQGDKHRYTGVFWFGKAHSRQEVAAQISHLRLVPVAALKKTEPFVFSVEQEALDFAEGFNQKQQILEMSKKLLER
jgi:hypothetical protein